MIPSNRIAVCCFLLTFPTEETASSISILTCSSWICSKQLFPEDLHDALIRFYYFLWNLKS